TELLGRLGDDAGEELRRAHFSLLRGAVAKSSGQEVKSLGDGLMVAFASPVDAVGCAVAMQRAVQGYNEQSGGHALAIRIGLHAGDPHREAGDFHGTAVVVASRLCDAAAGGQILASELVADLVGSRGGFSFRPLAQLTLKGLARPVATVSVDWNVEAQSEPPVPVAPAPARTSSRPPRPRGPELVGRDAVLVELEAELDRIRGGELRCVLLLGEPGVGKTRLTGELIAGPAEDLTALTARAYPLGATASLGLWVEALECHLRQLEPPEIRDLCGPYLDDLAALFGSLSPLRGERAGPEPSRVRILEGLVALLERVAGSGPLVVVLDDVHLADGSSWEALAFLARSLSTSPILIVLAARPVELSEQQVATQVLLALDQEGLLRRLPLSPLAPEDVRRLAGTALGERPVSEALLSWLMDRTRGNPLFVLGLVRALVEEGADLEAPALQHLPEDLAERVTSRLRRLGEAEVGLLELLAVLGRPVEFDDLIILSGQDGGRLGDLLPALVRSRLVAEEERGGELTYGVAHPLIQEALYQATGGARRRALHRSVGRTLLAARRLGEAASHFSRAARPGDPEAVSALLDAVRQAEERQAYRESLALLRSLVQLLPSGDERWLAVVDTIRWEANWVIDQPAELEVVLGIGALREMDAVLEGGQDPSRAATVKFRLAASIAWGEGSHDEAKRLYHRARELFEAAGNHHGALLSSNEVAFVSGMDGDLDAMEAGATVVLEAAEAADDEVVARRALATIGWSAFFRGRFALAEASYSRALDLTRAEHGAFRQTVTMSGMAISLAFEGRITAAVALLEEAKKLNSAHRATPLSEWETRVCWLAGDFASAVAAARDLLADTSRVPSPRTSMGLP
ncbi:MAG: ATP-binding protein, partial [Acidimicrobiia bacterium]